MDGSTEGGWLYTPEEGEEMSLVIPAVRHVIEMLLVIMGLWFVATFLPPVLSVVMVIAYMALVIMTEFVDDEDYERDS